MILRLTPSGNFWYIDHMRLLFIADGRSPIAQNWIRYFAERGDEVYIASTFACSVDFPLKELKITPVAFSGAKKSGGGSRAASSLAVGLRTALRDRIGPLTIPRAAKRLREFIQRVEPDLVHAMRIPYEGMLAADAYTGAPLVISVWGNDFTLHAASNRMMEHYTSWAMHVADGLHADCRRDIRLGKQWGFDPSRPALIVPGNGGVKTEVFYPPAKPVKEPIILNPRGMRAYVRNDVFFQAIPRVLAKRPDAKFVCASMAEEPEALKWIQKLGIRQAVKFLPSLPHAQMAEVFRGVQVVVSPSVHDGTPNTLLEGMACGCTLVAGDLESIREWISPGKNGLLADTTNPESLADAMLEALENKNLREHAAGLNRKVIAERAEYGRCMAEASRFYQRVIEKHKVD